jgi:hypothetical protein
MSVPGFGAAVVRAEAGWVADRTGFGHQAMLGQRATTACPPHVWPGYAGGNGRFRVQTMLHSK